MGVRGKLGAVDELKGDVDPELAGFALGGASDSDCPPCPPEAVAELIRHPLLLDTRPVTNSILFCYLLK